MDVGGFGIVWNKDIDLSRYEIWYNGEDVNIGRITSAPAICISEFYLHI